MPEPKSAAATFTSKEANLFRALVENHQGFIALLDENLQVLFRSASAERITGWANDELKGMPESLLHPERVDEVKNAFATALDNPGAAVPLASCMLHKNGHYIWLEGTVTNRLQDPDIRGLIVNLQDITERKKYEEKLVKINRLYRFISQINQAIVKSTDERALYAEACRIAVEAGSFRLALFGLVDDRNEYIVPVVHAGAEEDYLSRIRAVPITGPLENLGPGGRTIREGAHYICNDIEAAPEMAPWREAALSRGFYSSIGLPIRRSGKVIGLFSLYADIRNFFDTEEVSLLDDVATDISFALGVMEREERRKDAEAALIKSERSYQTLAETSPVGVFHTDAEGSTTYVNPRWCAIAGMPSEKALEWGWLQAVHPEDRASLDWAWQEAHTTRTPSRTAYRFLHPDGKVSWVLGQAVPELDATGEVVGYVGTITDITELKTAEQKIAGERNLSDSIINSLPGVFYLYNLEGRFIRWNTNFEKVTGYSPEEMRRLHPLNFFDEEEQELLRAKIENVFVSGEDSVEAGFLLKSGKKIPYFFTGKSLVYEGEQCLLGVGVDFSDKVRAQETIRETTERLRELAAHLQNIREEERTAIARDIHDDLGQQLTAVKLALYRLGRKASGDKEIEELVRSITDMVGKGIDSIRRIATRLRPGILDDLGLVEAMKWQVEEFEKHFDIVVEAVFTDRAGAIEPRISTNIFRIFQEALTNIARHAEATHVDVDFHSDREGIHLRIRDNGKGLNKSDIKTKRTLGLLGMDERTRMIGGTFDIEGQPGKGTAIEIAIPLHQKMKPHAHPDS